MTLWGFCTAFPITSSTVSSQTAQKYFAESSSCKAEMVRLMEFCAFRKVYRVAAIPCIQARRFLMNKESHLYTGKLLVPKKVVHVPTPTYFIPTVQSDRLPYLPGYVWLVLSNFLGHTRFCGKKSENRAEVVNKVM